MMRPGDPISERAPRRPLAARTTGAVAAWLSRRGAALGAWFDRAIGLPADRREGGQATVEFVILFPVFMVLFLSAFEASLYLTRQLMLERGLDLVMREVRLSTGTTYRQDQLRTKVCDNAAVLPDCNANLVVEMTLVNTGTGTAFTLPNAKAPCVARTTTAQAFDIDNLITAGTSDQMMLVRVCYVIDPVFPGAGLGLELVESQGEIQIVAASAFVQEP